ncbi:unnamed protein product [Caenorhabditis sp. 36 PRJEB53466]|nr:unnamed protein product [Caenorhabditis sp. 36 PRJEB53466]
MMMDAAPALNVIHYMKPKVCAYVGAYRKISFEVNTNLCRSLGLIEANYANALTNRFRVSYSNNTGYVELSEFIEFRCKEEEEEAKEALRRPRRKSIQVQTEPTESSKTARRTLPRTLPPTPVAPESPMSHSFYPTYPSPNSVIGSVLRHKSQIVTVGSNYLLVLDNRDSETLQRQDTVAVNENNTRTLRDYKTDHFKDSQHYLTESNQPGPSHWLHESLPEDDGSLLRRLKTEYFKSEEYTAAELCEHTPK